jgi:monoamine oxidase
MTPGPAANVVVVGAGFAGLRAAALLARRGADVAVLEARDRVGGRVWSASPFGDEAGTVERGGEYVLAGYRSLRRVAAAHGLALAPMGMSYGVREPRGGVPTTVRAVRRAAGAAAQAALSARAGASAADVFDQLSCDGEDDAALAAFRARFEISSAAPATEITARALAEGATSMSGRESSRVAGGNQRIALALAVGLGPRVLLGRTVERVAQSASGVELTVRGREGRRDRLTAAVCVLAVPLPHARRLLTGDRLPPTVQALMDGMGVGDAAKLHVALSERPEPSAVLDVPGRWWSWTARDVSGKVAPVVHDFAGTRAALAALEVDRGPSEWLRRLTARRDDLALLRENAVLTAWHADPWALGAYSHVRAGAPASAVSASDDGATTHGRIVLAGEWTAGDWNGLMEGALRSGERAARQALGLLRSGGD